MVREIKPTLRLEAEPKQRKGALASVTQTVDEPPPRLGTLTPAVARGTPWHCRLCRGRRGGSWQAGLLHPQGVHGLPSSLSPRERVKALLCTAEGPTFEVRRFASDKESLAFPGAAPSLLRKAPSSADSWLDSLSPVLAGITIGSPCPLSSRISTPDGVRLGSSLGASSGAGEFDFRLSRWNTTRSLSNKRVRALKKWEVLI